MELQMRWISEYEVGTKLDRETLINQIEQAFRELKRGVIVNCREIEIVDPTRGVQFTCYPAYSGVSHTYSVKVISEVDENPKKGLPLSYSLVCLFDGKTGMPLAVVSGRHLTALRTAAASAVATRWIARQNTDTLGIIGTGLVASAHAELIPLVRQFKQIVVASGSGDLKRAESFAANIQEKTGIACAHGDILDVASAADVLTVASLSSSPSFQIADLKEHVHINTVGRFLPTSNVIPVELLRSAGRVVSDLPQRLKEQWAVNQSSLSTVDFDRVESLADVVSENNVSDRMGRTVFLSDGLAIEDLAAANSIVGQAERQKFGYLLLST